MSGLVSSNNASIRVISLAVKMGSVWLGSMTSRSWSTSISNRSTTCCNISLCWPVETTNDSSPSAASIAFTTGAILIPSGRVPIKIAIFFIEIYNRIVQNGEVGKVAATKSLSHNLFERPIFYFVARYWDSTKRWSNVHRTTGVDDDLLGQTIRR